MIDNWRLVTVKLPKHPDHDPHNKVTGQCPVNGTLCTDVTGEHHTVLVYSQLDVLMLMDKHHITRVESVK